jgi:hypothetical protein
VRLSHLAYRKYRKSVRDKSLSDQPNKLDFSSMGKNRLVWVAVGSPQNNGDQKPRGNSGSDAPLIAALIQKLSAPGTNWSVDERMAWMQLMITGFQVA